MREIIFVHEKEKTINRYARKLCLHDDEIYTTRFAQEITIHQKPKGFPSTADSVISFVEVLTETPGFVMQYII